MSLAGVDPTAQTGVTGGVENTMQMEPTAEQREAPAEKSRELDHTNIGMSMDVLTRQFIYQGTYQWSTSDAPGSVIATFPIHPDTCNMYTSHVYKMFGAYVGGMKARMRIIGTAFYGGGIYMVRIPPQYKPSDIATFGLAGLTAFPHTDVDPKNLDSVDILLEDFRSEHFHTGPLNTNDPKSFGGWLALVVNARLVTQTAEIRSLDLRMEFAGDFQFQVPVPIRTAQTAANGPLVSLNFAELAGSDDSTSQTYSTYLSVLPVQDKTINSGNIFHRAAGGKYYYDENNSKITGKGAATWNSITDMRVSNDDGRLIRIQQLSSVGGEYVTANVNATVFNTVNYMVSNDADKSGWTIVYYADNALSQVRLDKFLAAEDASPEELAAFGSGTRTFNAGDKTLATPNRIISPITTDRAIPIITPNRADPWIGQESYVVIGSNACASINTQTFAWAQELAAFKEWPAGSAAFYNVLNQNGNIVAVVKLRENGHFYASASASAYVIQGGVRLQFRQWSPERDPIPVVPTTQRLMMNAATKDAVDAAVKQFTAKLSATSLRAKQ